METYAALPMDNILLSYERRQVLGFYESGNHKVCCGRGVMADLQFGEFKRLVTLDVCSEFHAQLMACIAHSMTVPRDNGEVEDSAGCGDSGGGDGLVDLIGRERHPGHAKEY